MQIRKGTTNLEDEYHPRQNPEERPYWRVLQITTGNKPVQYNLQDSPRCIHDFLNIRLIQLVLFHEDTERCCRLAGLVGANIRGHGVIGYRRPPVNDSLKS